MFDPLEAELLCLSGWKVEFVLCSRVTLRQSCVVLACRGPASHSPTRQFALNQADNLADSADEPRIKTDFSSNNSVLRKLPWRVLCLQLPFQRSFQLF
jgi:hypothetical protein